ncbi:metallophosphoesterase family protein [Rhizobium miluonense]|uniref:Calcineurin-like phosphoesterase n=1 Tax=Rhizobium miluonense TaxID=411945 RepID=A0A1C3XD35_9HYPH|nr:metallophosphoesterase [Rhizobium miluonense]SCB50158.1 Calcineurin-like phosphoesterase [Rhizobium miluonense]
MSNATTALPGPVFHEPIYSEGKASHDPTGFLVDHPSDTPIYDEVDKLLKTQVVGFDKSRIQPDELFSLEEALGPRGSDVVQQIKEAGRIVFHSIGDSGATTEGKQYADELTVADQLTEDCNVTQSANRPSFIMHLGDLVYSFGESKYYYDQFYAPFRDYPGPIFAVPGNHDSFVLPNTPAGETPLEVFARNFCSDSFVITTEAGSLHRTAMTQPGVYFALDAPFVRLLCLFSNALEDPGVISSEDGKWPSVPDYQLEFLERQLQKIKDEDYKGAVLIAVHHPPFSYAPPSSVKGSGGSHGCSLAMLAEIDTICKKVGVYPHAFLSGHAHNYQRYTRTVEFGDKTFDVPFIVCGDGGHHVNAIAKAKAGNVAEEPHFGIDVSYLDANPVVDAKGLSLEKYNDRGYGYLRISADSSQVAIGFHLVGQTSLAQSRFDKVTVDLASHEMIAN